MEKLINWSDQYSVKIKEIDEQHKKFLELVNDLYDAFNKEEQQEKIGNVIDEMKKYAITHFNTEEQYFSQFIYEDSEKHIEEHKQFLKQVELFQNELKDDHRLIAYKVLNFLRDWLHSHILTTDKKYITCFKANGLN
jgi:hemerythrin-like metal-binding protein